MPLEDRKEEIILLLRSKFCTEEEIDKILSKFKYFYFRNCPDLKKLFNKNNVIKKLKDKIKKFSGKQPFTKDKKPKKTVEMYKVLGLKIYSFLVRECDIKMKTFNIEDMLAKIGPNPTCYLTGQPIDLSDSGSYHLDHIIPISRGGHNGIDNCQIATRDANYAKRDRTAEEFLAMCKMVVNHNLGDNT